VDFSRIIHGFPYRICALSFLIHVTLHTPVEGRVRIPAIGKAGETLTRRASQSAGRAVYKSEPEAVKRNDRRIKARGMRGEGFLSSEKTRGGFW